MSVLIKGMDMPKKCVSCLLWEPMIVAKRMIDICSAVQDKIENPCSRPDWCPLVDVQTPHGRLGDLDKLEKMFVDIDSAPYRCFDGEEHFYSAEDATHIIRLAPTVIPASEEK